MATSESCSMRLLITSRAKRLIWEKDSVTGNKSDWASGSVRFDGLSDRF